ncbi:MAG: hypothetical protein KY475_00610 [Planctomycetes bacterium]|nr:hypothetical protein [Planctomycetota bacterium]
MTALPTRDTPFYLLTPPQNVRVMNWALRDDPWRAIPAVILGLTAAIGAGVVSQNVWAGLLASLAVAISLWRTWLPIAYEFDPRGVTQIALRRRRLISWLALGDYHFTPRGVLLYPRGELNWWNAAAGLFVLWSGRQEAIVQIVEYYLGSRLLLEESSRS